MEWLNYHHLLYFWTVAREGSIARASAALRLAQPTISAQVRRLEDQLGEKLFERRGRGLALTETGRVVFRYADEIFSLGRELLDAVKGRSPGRTLRFSVGVSDVVPKLVAHRLLEPALRLADRVRIVCHEDHADALLARLALHELDLVISDAPIAPQVKVRGFSHALGECGVQVFAAPRLAAQRRRGFPKSLDGAPMLLPIEGSALRRSLDSWLERRAIRPVVIGEFEDSALLKTFASQGAGLFAGHTAIAREICAQYGVKPLGRLDGVMERFYAISADRRLTHPAVRAITQSARGALFGAS